MSALAVMPTLAAPESTFIDSSSMQTVEKIDGNIVTFKDTQGQSNVYYVPDWMLEKYQDNLKVGTPVTLYNKNIIQGVYGVAPFGSGYVNVAMPGIPDLEAFATHQTRAGCTSIESPASKGLKAGSRVWYKEKCCLSTIPVVGAMSFYVKKEIVVPPPAERPLPPPPEPPATPAPRTW